LCVSVQSDIIEQMFEYGPLTSSSSLARVAPERATLQALQQRIRSMETAGISERIFPVSEPLQNLFPEGGLRKGVTYQCDVSASLKAALISQATSQGVWCALVGVPDMGLAAAQDMGVALERLVLVPHPGEQWLAVLGALSDVVGIIVLGPVSPPSQRLIATVAGRLRERASTLLVSSPWPHTEGILSVTSHRWEGLGQGHGMLTRHRVSVAFSSRHNRSPRRCDLVIDAWGAHSASQEAQVTDIARYRSAG